MTKLDLDKVHVLLYETKANIRRVIKFALLEIGFQEVHECTNLGDVKTVLRMYNPDLMILDLDQGHKAVSRFMRDIRHQYSGDNPFVVSIATTWRADPEIVRAALDGGVDDIIMKPISVQILSQRINNLIHNRREFIATTDYVGPERRSEEFRSPSEKDPGHIKVPNSLRYKATGDEKAVVDDAAVKAALEAVVLQKIQRLSIELSNNAAQLEGLSGSYENSFEISAKIELAAKMIRQVQQYIQGQKLDGIIQIANSMAHVMEMIKVSVDPKPKQFEILKLHSQAVTAALLDRKAEAKELAKALESVVDVTEHSASANF